MITDTDIIKMCNKVEQAQIWCSGCGHSREIKGALYRVTLNQAALAMLAKRGRRHYGYMFRKHNLCPVCFAACYDNIDLEQSTCQYCRRTLYGVRVGKINGVEFYFCSDRCERRLRYQPVIHIKSCEQCGAEFHPKRKDAKCCSAKCRVARNRKLNP